MTHLDQNRNVVPVLYDLNIVVVRGWSDRRSRALQDQTPFGQRPVFRAIEIVTPICGQALVLSFPAGAIHRWHLSVFRIDNQRGSPRFHDVGPAIPPEVIVGAADVGFRRAIAAVHVAAFDDVLFVFGRLLLRKKLFSREFRGPFKRRNGGPAPGALQIGLTVRRTQGGLRLSQCGCGNRRENQAI